MYVHCLLRLLPVCIFTHQLSQNHLDILQKCLNLLVDLVVELLVRNLLFRKCIIISKWRNYRGTVLDRAVLLYENLLDFQVYVVVPLLL